MTPRRTHLLIAIGLLALLHRCGGGQPVSAPSVDQAEPTAEIPPTVSPSVTLIPTLAPTATLTPQVSTATPAPTVTPSAEPSVTPSAEPTPTASPSFPVGEIAFTSHAAGDGELYLIDTTGAGRRRLVSGDADFWNPAWSPDGSQLAFVRRDGSQSDICLVSVGGGSTEPRCVTESSLENEHYPVWSPDGERIAFYAGSGSTYEIWVLEVQSALASYGASGVWQLTLGLAADNSDAFDWSPDGASLLFSSKHKGDREIYSVDVSQALEAQGPVEILSLDLQRITDSRGGDYAPRWSPDGSQILFYSARDGDLEIYLMDADGGRQERLTEIPGDDWWPDWSPDGTAISFCAMREDGLLHDIYVLELAGRNLRRLTKEEADNWWPAWRP